jgi:hypothetical protein
LRTHFYLSSAKLFVRRIFQMLLTQAADFGVNLKHTLLRKPAAPSRPHLPMRVHMQHAHMHDAKSACVGAATAKTCRKGGQSARSKKQARRDLPGTQASAGAAQRTRPIAPAAGDARRLRRSQAITRAHKERACCFHLADDEKAPRRALRVAHYDFKQGARAGAGSEAMKPVADALSGDDMLVLAAYVASLPPHGGETQ